MKIGCVINSLAAGGAERVILRLSGGLAGRGHDVTVITLSPGADDFYRIPAGVARLSPECPPDCRWYDLRGQLRRISALRGAITGLKPDVLISFIDITNILTLIAAFPGRPPVIVCERTNPLHHKIGAPWRLLRRLLYPGAAKVVMLTSDTLAWARSLSPAWNAAAIPNPVPPPEFSSAGRPEYFRLPRNIVAVGRLTEVKGFDMLLRSFAGIAGSFPQWQLTILGDGPLRAQLEALAASLGLGDRVKFPGTQKNTADVLRFSDLFVLSSRYEGFPNALTEALACGIPAVSFDCPSGPAEILSHGGNGLLVPAGDEDALAAAMAELMADDRKRARMSERAPEITGRYGLKNYLDSWETLLAGIRR